MQDNNKNDQIEVKDIEVVSAAGAESVNPAKVNEAESKAAETPNNDDGTSPIDTTAKASVSASTKKGGKKVAEQPLSPEQIEALKKETEIFNSEMARILGDPKYHATKSASGRCYMDLTAAHKAGVKIYVLDYNRTHGRDEKTTGTSLYRDGAQHILLVAPVRVTNVAGLPVSHFKNDPDQESPIDENGLAILDGSGRTNHAYGSDTGWPQLDAAFVATNMDGYIDVKKVYAVTNQNILTWGAKDHLIPRLVDPYELRHESFQSIHNLNKEGYKYTAACDWTVWRKGNVTITALNSRVTEEEAKQFSKYVKYGKRIHKACVAKFTDDASFLKTKKFPEWLIDKWDDLLIESGADKATDILVEFINQLTSDEVVKIVAAKRDVEKCIDKDTVRLQMMQELYSKFEAKRKAA